MYDARKRSRVLQRHACCTLNQIECIKARNLLSYRKDVMQTLYAKLLWGVSLVILEQICKHAYISFAQRADLFANIRCQIIH
jgi:hypothetical protein